MSAMLGVSNTSANITTDTQTAPSVVTVAAALAGGVDKRSSLENIKSQLTNFFKNRPGPSGARAENGARAETVVRADLTGGVGVGAVGSGSGDLGDYSGASGARSNTTAVQGDFSSIRGSTKSTSSNSTIASARASSNDGNATHTPTQAIDSNRLSMPTSAPMPAQLPSHPEGERLHGRNRSNTAGMILSPRSGSTANASANANANANLTSAAHNTNQPDMRRFSNPDFGPPLPPPRRGTETAGSQLQGPSLPPKKPSQDCSSVVANLNAIPPPIPSYRPDGSVKLPTRSVPTTPPQPQHHALHNALVHPVHAQIHTATHPVATNANNSSTPETRTSTFTVHRQIGSRTQPPPRPSQNR